MKIYPKLFCHECGASFTKKSSLQMHINAVHLKLKPYVCDLFEMSFARKGHLKGHIKSIHEKIRPFECNQCKKSFARKRQLKSQMQSSNCKNLKKKYKCKECENSFVRKDCLKHHVNRVHLKIKPLKKFICNECKAPFEKKQPLEHHMNKKSISMSSLMSAISVKRLSSLRHNWMNMWKNVRHWRKNTTNVKIVMLLLIQGKIWFVTGKGFTWISSLWKILCAMNVKHPLNKNNT